VTPTTQGGNGSPGGGTRSPPPTTNGACAPGSPPRGPVVVAVLALAGLVAVVFLPITGFSFVTLDVEKQVIENPRIRGLTAENVRAILAYPCVFSYYPVRTLTFALDYQFWGLNAGGFKLTNGLIHLANAVLVFWLIVRLLRRRIASEGPAGRPPGLEKGEVALAACCAGLFGVHPVVVEPVTWVAGREELLMTLGALGCFHFHLAARHVSRAGGSPRRVAACFAGAAISCAFACLSNAMGAVIPLLVTAWDVLTLPKPRLGRILRGTAALWLIGAVTVALKTLLPDGPRSEAPWTFWLGQPGVVLAGYWLNVASLAWPTKLSLSYPFIWPDNLPLGQVALGAIAAVATVVLVWLVRRRTLILFGLVWFGLALAPASQLLPHHLQRADRYLYLPLVGLAVAAAMALQRIRPLVTGRTHKMAFAAAGVGVLLLLALLSTRQVQNWRDEVTLWEHCVGVVPDDPRARGYLARAYDEAGQVERAAACYRRALEMDPNQVGVLNSYAIFLTSEDAPRPRDYRLAVELARRACRLTLWLDSDLTHTLARAQTSLANAHAAAGRYGPALELYREAIEAHPEYDMAVFNLALVLSTCPDKRLRDPDRAVEFAERGRRLARPLDAHRLSILATAYGEAGRFDDAIAVTQQAIEAAETAGDAAQSEQLRTYLRSFKNGLPLTASP